MKNALTQAAKKLELAAAYAEDGAVVTAIERTLDALTLLLVEKTRRVTAGLIKVEKARRHT